MISLESIVRAGLLRLGYDLVCIRQRKVPPGSVPNIEFYQPVFSPWLGYGEFGELFKTVRPHTLVSAERCWVLYTLSRQQCACSGLFAECGVYRGGTARLIAETLTRQIKSPPQFHLFDTFEGMPETDAAKDLHAKGDFDDTSLAAVQNLMAPYSFACFHPGCIPSTFAEMEKDDHFSFVHIDVDIYRSVLDCCEYFYPRMKRGAVMVFDDYGFITCPGARKAVDEFFADREEVPLSLPTGQAIVIHL